MKPFNRILTFDFWRVCLFLACFASAAAHAQDVSGASPNDAMGVALAVNLPDAGPRHREMAAGIVSEAQRRWTMLDPQLTPEAVAACADEEKCLVGLANKRQASHLLSVGIAALDRIDFVVSVKLIELKSGRELVSHADIGKPGFRPQLSGIELAKALFDPLPPEGQPALARNKDLSASHPNDMTWKSITGWTLAAAAPVVAGSAAAYFFLGAEESKVEAAIAGAAATAVLGCASGALLVWDTLE